MKSCHHCGRELSLLATIGRISPPGSGGAQSEANDARATFDSLFSRKR
jgi:hypothetical protein